MKNRVRLLVLFLFFFVVACATPIEIHQILSDPRAYDGKTVTVEGKVTDTFSLVFIKYFQLDDGTGTLNVVSDKALPVKGQRLKVTGEVRQAFSLGDQNIMVLVESEPKPKQ